MVLVGSERGEPGKSNSVRPQPLRIDPQLLDICQTLQDASGLLDITGQNLYNYNVALATTTKRCSILEQAYNEERRIRIDCARAYENLHAQYERAVSDLHRTTSKCSSVEQELKDALESVENEKAKIKQETEQALFNAADQIHDVQRKFDELKQIHQASMTRAGPSDDQGGTLKTANSTGSRQQGEAARKA